VRAALTQIRAAVLRRRAQTVTVLLVSLLAGGVSTMAVTLLVRSAQPWDDAFGRYSGAHLMFHFDASKVSAEQLAATSSLPGVTAAGPPHETVLIPFGRGSQKGQVQLIGRADPGGKIDRIPLAAGRWPERRGEIAVTRTEDISIAFRPQLGETIHALTGAGLVDFKVVGEVIDLGGHGLELDFTNGAAGAWALPADVEALVDGRQIQLGYEMAYRFKDAATEDQLAADRREIEAALPAGAETQSVIDWQRMRAGSIWVIELLSGIIVAFTVSALIAVTVIVGSVVAGSVLSSYREIGISKALGFTPAQVVAIQVGQMAVPGILGALAGLPLGALMSRPILDNAASSLKLPEPSIFDPVADATVAAALLLLVVAAAFVPALRAAATDSVRAIALGAAPPPTRRSRLAAGLARLRAPRVVSIGAGDAFARPVRALLTVTALGVGIATATFAIGFQATLVSLLSRDPGSYGYAQDLVVNRYPGISDASLSEQLAAQPETRVVVGQRLLSMRAPGEKDPIALYAMRGDPVGVGYQAVEGRWFATNGEAVIAGDIANKAHLRIGDTLNGSVVGGPALSLRIVGLVNDFNTNGASVRVGWDTIAAAMPDLAPNQYLVKLRPGSDAKAYASRVAGASPDFLDARVTSLADVDFYTNLLTFMVTGLALVLMAIAAAGVFNAARLTTQERVHDIAVLKAIGMSAPQIALMLVASTFVLTVVATLLGVPLGIWLESVIWASILNSSGFVLSLTAGLSPLPLALALLAAFVLALLGAALPARWAAATPVSEVLRSE